MEKTKLATIICLVLILFGCGHIKSTMPIKPHCPLTSRNFYDRCPGTEQTMSSNTKKLGVVYEETRTFFIPN